MGFAGVLEGTKVGFVEVGCHVIDEGVYGSKNGEKGKSRFKNMK